MTSVSKVIDQLGQFWNGLSGKQRALLLGGAVITAAVVLLFARLVGSPDYKPLINGLEPAEAESIAAQLATKHISTELGADGKSIRVAADKLDAARLEIASHDLPPSGRLGFELFDKVAWGQTEFDEKVNYQRAMEGELERTIQTLHDVESARVHLVMPTDSVFIDRERAAKASVILRLRRGTLSEETEMAISRLVSGAVDELKPENVVVIDAYTSRPIGTQHRESPASGATEQELTRRLVAILSPVVGEQSVRASVNVEYDPSTSEVSEEKYDPDATVALTMQRTEEQVGGGGAIGGVPGTSSNVPGAQKTSAQPAADDRADDNSQRTKSESGTYAVNKLVRHTTNPAGRIQRISASLLIDDASRVVQKDGKTIEERRKRTPEEMKQIEDLAKNTIGLDTVRGDTLSVQNLSFERPVVHDDPAPTKMERFRTTLKDWPNVIRYGALLLLFLLAYVLMLRPIKKQAIAVFKELEGRGVRSISKTKKGIAGDLSQTDVAELPQRAAQLKQEFMNRVQKEPANTGRLIQALLREDEI